MDQSEFTAILDALQSQRDLTRSQMQRTIQWFLSGQAPAGRVQTLLELLADKGESVAELVGAAEALRHSMQRLDSPYPIVLDTCGTGGDGAQTFNISTAAAIVTAAAGVPVAKHGNRKITSSTGSADVLAELGINLAAAPEVVQQCLAELGICFCFAPHFHPAMRHVGPIRQRIGRPTIFNRLGPLANPAGAHMQVLGVGDLALQDKLAAALQQLGTQHSIVVRGEDGVDELSLSAPTRVLEVTPARISEHLWQPADFGLATANRQELFANDPASSAACIREVLAGKPGAKRDVVVLNAAASLWVAGRSQDLEQCARLAAEAIDSGQARRLVDCLAARTQQV